MSDVSVESTTTNYVLTFDENNWSTSGGYSYNYEVNVDQINHSDELTISDAVGSGDYQLDGNIVTLSNGFVSFDVDGYDMSSAAGEQQAELSFDGSNLVVSQDIETTQDASGATVTATVKSTSVWSKR